MQIFIRTADGRLAPTHAEPFDTVSSLLVRAGERWPHLRFEVHENAFNVSHQGRVLLPDSKLGDENVQSHSILTLCGSLKGGMIAMRIAMQRARSTRLKQEQNGRSIERTPSNMLELIEELVGGPDGELVRKARDEEEIPQWVNSAPADLSGNAGRLDRFKHKYFQFAWWLNTNVVTMSWFEGIITACILAVGVTTGSVLNGYDSNKVIFVVIEVISWITFAVFTLEAALKIIACGPNPLHYFRAPKGNGAFNTLDFILVILGLALIGQDNAMAVKTLRLARLARLLTFVKNVPELKVILIGLIAGMKSVGYIVSLLLLVIYLFAIFGTQTFGENDPANFGVVPVSMMTLFQMSTLAGWSAIANIEWYGCDHVGSSYTNTDDLEEVETWTGPLPSWSCHSPSRQPVMAFFFFTSYTILTSMVIMSLFIGVITMGMFDAYDEMKNMQAALEYRTGLMEVKKTMFEPGSTLCKLVDDAMKPELSAAQLEEVLAINAGTNVSYVRFVQACRKIESHVAFQVTISICIGIAGCTIGFQIDEVGNQAVLWIIDFACLIIFTFEVFIKLFAVELSLRDFFGDRWNVFDTLIVINGWFEVFGFTIEGVAVLRLLRLLRLLRVVRALPRLRSIVESLVQGFSSVGWVMVLLIIFNYIVGCLGVILFQKSDPFHYGNVQRALFTTYSIETLDNWEMVYRINMYGCDEFPAGYPLADGLSSVECKPGTGGFGWLAAAYFVFVVIFGGLVLPTMLIGIVAVSFEESFRKTEDEKTTLEESERILNKIKRDMPGFFSDIRVALLRRLFNAIDVDKGGTLDLNEITPLIKYICRAHLKLNATSDEVQSLVTLFDTDQSSDLNFGEVVMIIRYLLKAMQSGRLSLGDTNDEESEEEEDFIPDAEDFSASKKMSEKNKKNAMDKAAAIDGLGSFAIDDDDDDAPPRSRVTFGRSASLEGNAQARLEADAKTIQALRDDVRLKTDIEKLQSLNAASNGRVSKERSSRISSDVRIGDMEAELATQAKTIKDLHGMIATLREQNSTLQMTHASKPLAPSFRDCGGGELQRRQSGPFFAAGKVQVHPGHPEQPAQPESPEIDMCSVHSWVPHITGDPHSPAGVYTEHESEL